MIETLFTFTQMLILFYLIYVGLMDRKNFLFTIAFLIPLQALSFDIGVLVSWHKIIFPIFILCLSLRKILGPLHTTNLSLKWVNWFCIFIFYSIASTLLINIIDISLIEKINYAKYAFGWKDAQANYRFIIQTTRYVFVFSLFFIGYFYCTSKEECIISLEGYILGNIFSIFVGVVLIVSLNFGINIYSYLSFIKFFQMNAINPYLDSVNRMYGLGGEPKHIAASIILSIFVLLFHKNMSQYRWSNKTYIIFATILVAGLILTASTSGIFVFFILLSLYSIINFRKLVSSKNKIILLSISIFFPLLILGINFYLANNILVDRVAYRLTGGYSRIASYEPKDAGFIEFLKSHPYQLIFGKGAGGIDVSIIPYVRKQFLIKGATPTPTYTIFRLIGDFGYVGLTLLILSFLQWAHILSKINPTLSSYYKLLCFGILFMPFSVTAGFFFISGALISFAKLRRTNLIGE